MTALSKCGAVVAGENDQCIFVDLGFFERFQNFTDAPIHFLNDIAVESIIGAAREFFGNEKGNVGRRVGEIEKKGLLLVFANESHRMIGVALGKVALIWVFLNHCGGIDDLNRREFLIETLRFSLPPAEII